MICKNCGHENKDGAKLCRRCGTSLEKDHQRLTGENRTARWTAVKRPPETAPETEPAPEQETPTPPDFQERREMAHETAEPAYEQNTEPLKPPEPDKGEDRVRVVLRIIDGPMKGREFTFDEHDAFLFGRTPNCHAFLPNDTYASRHHFLLEVNPPHVRVRDLGSLNGTHVNGVKYGGREQNETPEQAARHRYPEVDLRNGDRIQTGATVFSTLIEMPGFAEVTLTCARCGKRISMQSTSDSSDCYVCESCLTHAEEDPLSLLRASENGRRDPQADAEELPDIPGYRIRRKIGQGGMGAVYLAECAEDQTFVALKILLPRVQVEERHRRRFMRELENQRELCHPNVVSLKNSGVAGCVFWFVTEYCNRGNAADMMKRYGGKVPLKPAVRMMLDALRGLAYAHRQNLTHRDLKPENILLHKTEKRETARIADFGLAKNFDKAGLSGLTMTGAVCGTYPFMPREQVTNFKYVKPASDVWSAAATLYYLLTGKYPRETDPDQDPVQAVLEGDVTPIRERDASIPEKVAGVIDRGLAPDPSDRYPEAHAFREALKTAFREWSCAREDENI